MNYTNREVVRRLKQYDMFLDSLKVIPDKEQKERIFDQLDKIEKQILLGTNSEYEEEYMLLLGESTKTFKEEKKRLRNIITLILDRRQYLEERKRKHKNITGSLVELTTFLGEDKLSEYRKNLRIIEKYEENKERQEVLIDELKVLDVKISEASRNVKANLRLDESLESKMISLVDDTLKKLDLYKLMEERKNINKRFVALEYACNIARENLRIAKESKNEEQILECDNLLSEIMLDYSDCNEKVNILNLIDIFDKKVTGYEEILAKREKLAEVLKNLSGSQLYEKISDELNKQYNTIKLQAEDIETYNKLKTEREHKNKVLYSIEEENNSKEFRTVLEDLIRNETRIREEQVQKARREEFLERQKKLLEEQKIEASRVKRQKLIEEARLKDQQARAEKIKELQEKTVINPKKEEEVKPKTEEPLKVQNIEDKFNTDELFENTKITPNKVLEVEKLDSLKIEDPREEPEVKEEDYLFSEVVNNVESNPLPDNLNLFEEPSTETNEVEELPSIIDLFKENQAKSTKVEVQEEDAPTSIYDILEHNPNIMWKKTETESSVERGTIPVIGNNNLKPEIIDNKEGDKIPESGSKEGEILWKETI